MRLQEPKETRDARAEYLSLRLAIEDFVHDVVETHGEHIRCRRGCFMCCVPPATLYRIEGERVRRAVGRLPEAVRERVGRRASDESRLLCPLLEDGACLIYDERPVMCRTQGMALATQKDARTYDLDHCRLNFQSVPTNFELRRRHILNLDGTNEILGELNRQLVANAGLDPAQDGTVSFRKAVQGRLLGVPAAPNGAANGSCACSGSGATEA